LIKICGTIRSMTNTDEWVSAAQAAAYLGRTDRQVRRYKESGRVRTRNRGARIQYHKGDLERLRGELGDDIPPQAVSPQVLPAGELLDYIKQQQEQIAQLSAQIGYLRAQLEQRPALEDTQATHDELVAERVRREAAEQRIKELEQQVTKRRSLRWPWQKDE
jgi:hypothetical protein